MSEPISGASTFVFTSFQGGVGKTSTALKFALALQRRTLRPTVFFECNWFIPSTLSAIYDLSKAYGQTFLEFYKNDCLPLNPDEISSKFLECDGLWLMPFTGISAESSLEPGFIVNEIDLVPSLKRLLVCLSQVGAYTVFDMTASITPFFKAVLTAGDIVYYIYNDQHSSISKAEAFLSETGRWKGFKERLVFLHNMVDLETRELEKKLYEREFLLPIFEPVEALPNDRRFDKCIADIVEEAITRPAGGSIHEEKPEVDVEIERTLFEYRQSLRNEIVSTLEKRFGLSDHEMRRKVENAIEQAFKKNPPPEIPTRNVKSEIKKALLDDILGLGPLEDFLKDPDVDEIMVNGPTKIFIEKRGRLYATKSVFNNDDHVRTVIDRILMPIGRTLNERTPFVDARLLDGSRVHAIIPPLSLTGPMLTIRKFSRIPYTMEDLVYRFKTLTMQVAEFLKLCVKLKRNIIISGGASSGKTTLLNVLSMHTQPDERIICIEDSAELKLSQENLGRLEARPQIGEAKTQITIRDLVRNALRMRPDRIIVGECRGEEALDMLQAMNTGHEGSLTTLHANSSRDALARLETMVLTSDVDLPLRAVREQIASAVNMIVQTARLSDGTRRIIEVAEVVGMEDTTIQLKTVFRFDKQWIGEDGRVFGELSPTGYIPKFIAEVPGHLLEKSKCLFIKNDER